MLNDHKVYNCLIIDDEPFARKVIKDFCNEIDVLHVVAECSDAVQAIPHLKASIDIIYLDINMPKISGIEFFESISKETLVIFTTAYPDFAAKAFELEAFDYLVKPISLKRFLKSFDKIERYFQQFTSEHNWIAIKEGKRLYKLNASEIHYIQAYGDYIKIFTSDKVYVPKLKLQDFYDQLPSYFLQVHRSFVINLNEVEYIEGNHLELKNNKIPISNTFKQSLLERL